MENPQSNPQSGEPSVDVSSSEAQSAPDASIPREPAPSAGLFRKYRYHIAGVALVLALATNLLVQGGSRRLPTVPVHGKVLYAGKPLEYGAVLLQPDVGPPAFGSISPDGNFRLTTYDDGDGAVPGRYRVQITCFESQRPGAEPVEKNKEPVLGKSFIPEKYTRYDTSGLQVEVKQDPAGSKLDFQIE